MTFQATTRLFTSILCAGVALAGTGCCGSSSRAEKAQSPPPQTLSEPVRVQEPRRNEPPIIPVTDGNDEYAAQKPGESRPLPQFVAPPQAETVALPVSVNSEPVKGGGRYHTLQKGETVYGLARQYNVTPKKIIESNQFKDPSRLAVGTKVYIPE